jgi:hypothetical protein
MNADAFPLRLLKVQKKYPRLSAFICGFKAVVI